jgi:hydrogenase nickel incorporation protein HypB
MMKQDVPRKVDIVTRVLDANDRIALENRKRFAADSVVVIDVMGSPGSGKTSLLEATIPRLPETSGTGVIVGDIATSRDAWRIALHGVPAIQIVTENFGGACHLEAGVVAEAYGRLDASAIDLLFIENVGNLVCPAEFDLGQDARVLVISVTEGEDKPLKYPLAFHEANLVLVNKCDLVPYLDIDMNTLLENICEVNPNVDKMVISAKSGQGMDVWMDWIAARRTARGKIAR